MFGRKRKVLRLGCVSAMYSVGMKTARPIREPPAGPPLGFPYLTKAGFASPRLLQRERPPSRLGQSVSIEFPLRCLKLYARRCLERWYQEISLLPSNGENLN